MLLGWGIAGDELGAFPEDRALGVGLHQDDTPQLDQLQHAQKNGDHIGEGYRILDIKDSYGINFKRLFIVILTEPAVAWKNDPCGK